MKKIMFCNRRHLEQFCFALLFSLTTIASFGQELECDRQADVYYRLAKFMIEEPEDDVLKEQYNKLQTLDQLIIEQIQSNPSFNLIPLLESVNFTKQHGYIIEGLVSYYSDSKEYKIYLLFQTTCGNKVLAESSVSFQMYPSWDPVLISKQAVSQLLSKINIAQLEDDMRYSKNYGLGGDVWGGRIMITMNTKLIKGEQTKVEMRVVDCDGLVLKNKEISTQGTTGGVITPAKIKTNADGVGVVTFRMTTDKTAVVKVQCETKNVWECKDLYTGTELVKAVGGLPVRVEVTYSHEELNWVKRATLPGVKIKGGQQSELTQMQHTTVLYHYPSPQAIKKGYLVDAEINSDDPGTKTEFITEQGWFIYTKSEQGADITAGEEAGITVHGTEPGEEITYMGDASVEHPSKVVFYKGDASTPAYFGWEIEYPASNNGIAAGIASFAKGDPDVSWKVKKIEDAKSPYKTEYILGKKVDIAREFREGEKGMKSMFGFDLNELSGLLDPTNPQKNLGGSNGYRIVRVRILSPY